MSYDLHLKHPVTGELLMLDEPHQMKGGTYALGGTKECWLNVTYNYGHIFRGVLGDEGIRSIYGLTGTQSLPILRKAIGLLKDDVDDDYWHPTEGNARKALLDLAALAELQPRGIWSGD